jgi:hypothetical protein
METKIWAKYFGKTYIQHEASMLLNTKVLKAKPIEFMNCTFIGSSYWVPPRSNGSILKVNFLQGHGYLYS